MINLIKNFFIGSYKEFKKVIWPSKKEVTSHTVIVIASIVIAMVIIAAIDYVLFTIIEKLIINRGA